MTEEIVAAPAREVEQSELDEMVSSAFQADHAIKQVLSRARTDMWELAARFHDWEESKRWKWLGGYDTLNDWLAEPEIGVSRSLYFDLRKAWEQIVVLRGADVDELRGVDWSKVRLMLPAISSNTVDIESAIEDARALGWRDIREKYCQPKEKAEVEPEPGAEESDDELDPPIEGRARPVTDEEPVFASDVGEPEPESLRKDTVAHGHFDGPDDIAEGPDAWDYVRCNLCSGVTRARDLIKVEPDEVDS